MNPDKKTIIKWLRECRKECPVDLGKLLIGLECCRFRMGEKCKVCPYYKSECDIALIDDALAYIHFLEERLGVTG